MPVHLFDSLVNEALANQPALAPLRSVVEKELLHHDILRTLHQQNFLHKLTFMGGTCLRYCYGSLRLSGDLDFTGGSDFSRASFAPIGQALIQSLKDKYGALTPAPRIKMDICAVPSYETHSMMLSNPYGIDMGTNGLVVQAQSREEIYTDKLFAVALRPNRLHYRDLWDMLWLHGQGLKPRFALIPPKLKHRNCTLDYFLDLFEKRRKFLRDDSNTPMEFEKEMHQFLTPEQVRQTLEQENLWTLLGDLMEDLGSEIRQL